MKELVLCKHFIDNPDNKWQSLQVPEKANQLLAEGWHLENTFYSEGAVVFVLSRNAGVR